MCSAVATLHLPEHAVQPGQLDQLVVCAVFDQLTIVDHEDLVSVAQRRQTVGDQKSRLARHETPQAVEKLFETLRRLSEEGCSILYISHKLDEIRALCHTATVLRAGKVTGTCDPRRESSSRATGEHRSSSPSRSSGAGAMATR